MLERTTATEAETSSITLRSHITSTMEEDTADANGLFFQGFCPSSVLKFLPLNDVISYGSTSTSGLADLSAEIRRRRRRMLCSHQWAYAIDDDALRNNNACASTSSRKEASFTPAKYRLYSVDDGTEEDRLNLLMPVVDRLRILLQSKSFVSSHPLYARVQDLHDMLQDDRTNNSVEMNTSIDTAIEGERQNPAASFENSILELRRASQAHRLHADILTDAIRPQLSITPTNRGASITVPLDRYVGDVLVAYFFMSHVVSGLVEGGPTEEAWMDETLKSVSGRNAVPVAAALYWYRTWIFLHSTVLRTAPFLPEHSALLGIEPRRVMQDGSSGVGGVGGGGSSTPRLPRAELIADTLGLPPLIPPPPPFVGSDKRVMMSRLSQLRDDAPVKITKSTFGGLGPAFRGRDNVSSETVWPMRAISVVVAFFGLPPSAYLGQTNPALLRWREGTEAGIRWLLDVHKEAGKTRPMTVRPPFLTITTKA